MLPKKTSVLLGGIGVALVLLTLFFSANGIGQSPVPSYDELSQTLSLSSQVNINPSRFPYPGLFDAEMTLSNSILLSTSPITCDAGVAIIPAAPQDVIGNEQITPVFIWIPPRVPEEMTVVSCTAPSSIGSLPLTITIGPRPELGEPKGLPPCDSWQSDQIAYEPGETVIITYANHCPMPIRFGSKSPWFIYNGDMDQVVYTPPVQLEITTVNPGQQLKWEWSQRDNHARPVPLGTYYMIGLPPMIEPPPLGDRGYRVGSIAITELPDPRLLMRFDTNENAVIDDEEFFSVVDLWASGLLKDELFFALIDAWVSQTAVRGFAAPFKPVLLTIHSRRDSIAFAARGSGIASIVVEIFDLNGQRVFAQDVEGTRLTWNLRSYDGHYVATGVYLYVVIAHGLDGRTLRSEVKMLVVLR